MSDRWAGYTVDRQRDRKKMCFCCVLFVAEKIDSKCKYNTSGRVYGQNTAEAWAWRSRYTQLQRLEMRAYLLCICSRSRQEATSIIAFTRNENGCAISILPQFLPLCACDKDACSTLSSTEQERWTFFLDTFILGHKWSILRRCRPLKAANGLGVFEERTDLCDTMGSTWINWQLAGKH